MDWNRLSIFKLPNRHKRFDYTPRYYDPRKEALKEKVKRAEMENGVDEDGTYAREVKFKADMAERWGNSEFRTQSFRSNIRLIIILAIVVLAFYYLFIGLDVAGVAIDENIDKLK
ncbi:hypothetical protein [Crocinitomix algicola]|uniref:hypothetical protein n=1 Tax=Crocinitomix algicola TaxID=1740263 RepID=UPI0008730FE7|nr:hypothetical protein [Crocinitomix algicola]